MFLLHQVWITGDYMLYGHNGGPVSSWITTNVPSDILNMSFRRIAREWRVDKTGDAGTVTITGDYSGLPAPPAGYSVHALLVDSDGDFTSGAVEYPLTDIGSNKFQVPNVTLNDGDYITFTTCRISNETPCSAYSITPQAACNFQLFSNEGANDSGIGNPGNCDGTGSSGYNGGDVWFKVVVPASGTVIINTDTESASQTNLEWAFRIGIAVYTGTCSALTQINCQISPVSQVPPSDVNLTVNGLTAGDTLFLRMWEYDNNDNGKFRLCVHDPCLIPPVITGLITPSTVEGCSVAAVPAAATTVAELETLGLSISDLCTADGLLTVNHTDNSTGQCPIVITRHYVVSDPGGNNSSYDQIIYIDDSQPPVITGSLSTTQIEGCTVGAVPLPLTTVADLEALPGSLSIADACTSDLSLTVSSSQTITSPCPIRVSRIYTITDVCGNASSLTHVIEVNDTQPPVVTGALSPFSVNGCTIADAPAAASSLAELEALPGGINVIDGCTASSGLIITHTDSESGQCPLVITRTYRITDACSNYVEVNQTININDTNAPVIAGSFSPVNIQGCSIADVPTAAGSVAQLEALPGGITIADACTAASAMEVTYSDVSSGSCPAVVTRTYTVKDACGNSSSISQTININDTQSPEISGSLSDAVVEGCGTTDAPAAAVTVADLETMAGGVTITDNCTPSGSLNVSYSDVTAGSCPTIITRTYQVSDICGNESQIVQIIRIGDTQAPVVTGSLSVVTVEGCNVGSTPAPVMTVAGLEGLPGYISIADACTPDASLIVTNSDVVSGQCPHVVTRTYSVKDGCNNIATIVQTIDIDDTQPPVITGVLDPLTMEGCSASDVPAPVTTVAALEALGVGFTVHDICTANSLITVTNSDVSSGTCPVIVTRTYTLKDVCGNASTTNQIIYVQDTKPPVITGALSTINVEGCSASDAPAAVASVADLEALSGGISITDLCTPAASLVVTSSDSYTGVCPVVVTRTYTVTDNCGNSATVVQIIDVDDTQPPLISGTLNDITVEGCTSGDVPAPVATIGALLSLSGGITVHDACTADALLTVSSADVQTGSCPLLITRTYEVTDGCGNSGNIRQKIYVADTQAAVISGTLDPVNVEGCKAADAPSPVSTVTELEALNGSILVNDACTPDASLTVTSHDDSAGSCPVVVTRTYVITDNCGNQSTVTQTINIEDTQAPVYSGTLSPLTAEGCIAGAAPAAVTSVAALEAFPGGLNITDSCSPDIMLTVTSSDAVSGSCPLVITRTYEISDQCGNLLSLEQTINITDSTPPVISGTLSPVNVAGCNIASAPPAAMTVTDLEALPGGISTSDACSSAAQLTVTHTDQSTGYCPIVVTRKYIITDQCGNSSEVTQIINIQDTTPPTFTVPPDITIYKDASCNYNASVSVTGDVNDEADNCSSGLDAAFTDVVVNGARAGEQIITRTWKLSDACGNVTTHIQTINVKDNTPPTFTVPPDITIYKDASCGYNSSTSITGDVTDEADNCDNTLNATYSDAITNGLCEGQLVVTRVWSLTDDCGNSTVHYQTITVADNTPPTFTVPPDVYVCRNADCTFDISTPVTGDVIDEKDNCSTGLNATYTDNLSGASDCSKAGVVLRTWSLTDKCGNSAPAKIQTIYINPVPAITVTPDDQLLCYSGQSLVFTIGTTNSMVPGNIWQYDVSVSYPAGVSGNLTAGLTNQTSASITDSPVNNTDVVQTVTYVFTPHIKPENGGTTCTGATPVTITVDLDPRPKISVTADQLLCYDGNAVFTISTPNTILHSGSLWLYDVTVTYPAGVTGSWPTGLVNQISTSLTDDLTNNTDVVQTVTYVFTPHIKPGDGGTECTGATPVTITVDLDPRPKISVTADQLLCYDGNAVFTISTPNTTLHSGSQWLYDVTVTYPAGVTGSWPTGLVNQTSTSLTDDLTNNTDVVQTITYVFTPQIKPGDGGTECTGATPVTITVDLDPRPKISVTADQLLCYDGNAVFTISTPNTTLHSGSQWLYDVTVTYPAGVTGSWPTGLVNQISTSLTDDLTNNTDVVQTVTYVFTPHIKPGDGGTECTGATPVTITVDLDPRPKISVTTDQLLCYDGNAVFTISTPNTTLHSGSQWLYDVTVTYPAGVTGNWGAGLLNQNGTTLTDDLTNTTNTVQTVYYTFTPHIRPGDGGTECGDGTAIVIRVDLDPQPKITVATSTAVCYNDNAVFNISTVNVPVYTGSLWRYDVNVVYPAGVTGSWASGLNNQTDPTLTDNLNNSTDVVQTIVYTFTPHIKPGDGGAECTNGIPFIINLQINPQPSLFPVPPNTIQCDSTLTDIVLQSPNIFSSGVITFDQTVSGDGSITGYPTTSVTGLPNAHIIADRLINHTDSYNSITYRIVPVSPTGCANGVPVDISVTVNPTPRVIPVNPNLMRDSSICTGGSTRVVLTSPTVMTSGTIIFDYSVSVSGAAGVVTGNTSSQTGRIQGYTINYPYQNSSDTIQSVYYNIIPKVDNAICVPGNRVISEVKIHAKTLQNLLITTPLTCDGGSDAAIRAVPSKGAGLYYYDWIRTSTDQVHGYGITDLVNRKGGRWDVKVTDNLGCTSSGYVFVEGAFLDSYMYVVDTSGYGTTCHGSNNGEIWIYEKTSSTGIPPFEYWIVRNSQDTVIHGSLPTVGLPQQKWYDLMPGNYKLFIRDSNGCYNLNYPEAVITEPDPIQVTLDKKVYSGDNNVSCKGYSDGSAWMTASPTGGNGNYRFKWFTYDGIITGPDSLDRIDNLPAGTYYLRVTDRKGCTSLDSVKIKEPDGMVLASSDIYVAPDGFYNISCNGGSDGYIKITISGGSGNYTYSWTGPGTFTATTKDIAGLKAGTYTLTVRDISGCILMPQPQFVLTEPDPMEISSLPSISGDGAYNINCHGGTGFVDITITGGIPGTYIYEWTTTDGSGIRSGNEDQDSLTAGTYHLKVTDRNLCVDNYDLPLTEPSAIDLKFTVTNITCQSSTFDNGSVDLTASGGVSPYSFSWSTGSSSEDIAGLTEGSYSVTVTDLNGCTITDSARVNMPPPLTYKRTISEYNTYQISCFGMSDGSISIQPTSGEAPYLIAWTGPDGFVSASNEISGLKAGDYILQITDKNYCSVTDTFHLMQPLRLGMIFTVSESISGGYNINCAGAKTGSISVEPVNAAGAASYLWSDGATGDSRSDLGAGTYQIIMTDGNNCHADSLLTLTEPDSIRFKYHIVRPFCPDMTDGQVVIDSVGGGVPVGTYTYLWSDNSSSRNLTGINAGRYGVTISDGNGCTVTLAMNVKPLNDICLVIPEAFSPNGDLINDHWNIGLIDLYPEVEVTVFNRWGEVVWKSARGYSVPWDGRSKGRPLPMDSYHYIIDLHNGSKLMIGNVTIVR